MKDLAIIIPAYNEEKRIRNTLETYSEFFEKVRLKEKVDYSLIVVINKSTDGTEEIVKKFVKKNKRIRYVHLPRKGKGYAVTEGFKMALEEDYKLIGFVDADMATSPEEYWKLVKNIGSASGAIADRYLSDSKVYPPVTFRRLIVGRTFNFIVRGLLVLPYRDTQCGAKLFRKSALQSVISQLSMSNWAFDVELLYLLNKHGFYIKSCPTIWVDKEYSTINFVRATPGMFLGIVRLRLIHSPLSGLIRAYDRIAGLSKHL